MFGLRYNHHTVVSGNVNPISSQDYNGRGCCPGLAQGSRGTLRGSPLFGWLTGFGPAISVGREVWGWPPETEAAPTHWASPLTTAVSRFTQLTHCAVCLWKGSLSSLWVLIVSLTSFFKRAALHWLEKLRCNWHIALCRFNTYNVLISYLYISRDDYHPSVS